MTDAVFDAGMGAVAGFQESQLPGGGVGDERLIAPAVAFLEERQLRARVGSFASHDDPHAVRPARQVQQAGQLSDITTDAISIHCGANAARLEVKSNEDQGSSNDTAGNLCGARGSIPTSALAHADDVFIACPSGRDGVVTSVTSCEFADNVRRAYLDQYGPVVLAYSSVTGNVRLAPRVPTVMTSSSEPPSS